MKFFGHTMSDTMRVFICLIALIIASLLMYSGNFLSLDKNYFGIGNLLLEHPNPPGEVKVMKVEPQLEYEITRRRIEKGILEYEKYMSSQLKKIQTTIGVKDNNTEKLINDTLEEGRKKKRMLSYDFDRLKEIDEYESWREKESQELSDIVQSRLTKLQNPTDCSTAKILICEVERRCGCGCELHFATYCLQIAYITNRTLILNYTRWPYIGKRLEDIFLPVSNVTSCLSGEVTDWPGTVDSPIVKLLIASKSITPADIPLTAPVDLSERLKKLHGDPFAWWVGQIFKYYLKPNMETQFLLDEAEKKMGFKKPIVGVHVRRTDKIGVDSVFHPLDEYMVHVEEYFKKLEMRSGVDKRRIYLASDDPAAINEAKLRYPDYEILGDSQVAENAALSTRFTPSSLDGIIRDIYFLARTDYVVCGFSSNICRGVYEIIQQFYPDASQRVHSIDKSYFFYGKAAE